MREHDDDQFRASLRRAVTTATPADDAWPAIARRVRRRRAGRAAARAGIPALCFVVLLGGAVALSRRGDGSGGVGTEPPNTLGNVLVTLAPSTTVPSATTPAPPPSVALAVPSPADVTTAATSVSSSAAVVTTVPSPGPDPSLVLTPDAWPLAGRSTSFGLTVDVSTFELAPGVVCVGVRGVDGGGPIVDACSAAGHSAAQLAGDRLYVTGVTTSAAPVMLHTTAGDGTVAVLPRGDVWVYVAGLPFGADLVAVGDGPSMAACPIRDLIGVLRSTGWMASPNVAVEVDKCVQGVAGLFLHSTSELVQSASAILERVDGTFEAVNLGGDLCNRDPALQTSSRELAACDKIGWGI